MPDIQIVTNHNGKQSTISVEKADEGLVIRRHTVLDVDGNCEGLVLNSTGGPVLEETLIPFGAVDDLVIALNTLKMKT
jgi:hypothetical protein